MTARLPLSGRPALIAAVATAIATLGACGQNLSGPEFREGAGAACAATSQELGPLPPASALEGEALADYAEEAREILRQGGERMKSIVPSRDAAPDYGELLDHHSDLVEQLEEVKDVARKGDAEAAESRLDEMRGTAEEARALARELELTECTGLGAALLGEEQG